MLAAGKALSFSNVFVDEASVPTHSFDFAASLCHAAASGSGAASPEPRSPSPSPSPGSPLTVGRESPIHEVATAYAAAESEKAAALQAALRVGLADQVHAYARAREYAPGSMSTYTDTRQPWSKRKQLAKAAEEARVEGLRHRTAGRGKRGRRGGESGNDQEEEEEEQEGITVAIGAGGGGGGRRGRGGKLKQFHEEPRLLKPFMVVRGTMRVQLEDWTGHPTMTVTYHRGT